eukprot:6592922-Pyramimonas_sp.AAC.1
MGSVRAAGSTFPGASAARAFSTFMSDKALCWQDVRTSASATLRVRQDLPVDVRAQQGAASRVWEATLALFKQCKCRIADFRLGVYGFQCFIHLTPAEETFELFWTKGGELTGFTFEPVFSSFAWWKNSEQE